MSSRKRGTGLPAPASGPRNKKARAKDAQQQSALAQLTEALYATPEGLVPQVQARVRELGSQGGAYPISLTQEQSEHLGAKRTLTWGDVLQRLAFTFTRLQAAGIPVEELHALQGDPSAWDRAGKVTPAERAEMEKGLWAPDPFWTACAAGGMLPHQITGARFLVANYDCGHGAIQADIMGLGKSVQTIAAMLYLRQQGVQGPMLLTAPASVLPHWRREFDRWTANILKAQPEEKRPKALYFYVSQKDVGKQGLTAFQLRQRLLERAARMAEADGGCWPILLTSDHLHHSEPDIAALRALPGRAGGQGRWALVVTDEGHRLKNEETGRHKVLKGLRPEGFFLLTGTPVNNNVKDEIEALLRLVVPPYMLKGKLTKEMRSLDNDRLFANNQPSETLQHVARLLYAFTVRRLYDSPAVRQADGTPLRLQPRRRFWVHLPRTPLQVELAQQERDRKWWPKHPFLLCGKFFDRAKLQRLRRDDPGLLMQMIEDASHKMWFVRDFVGRMRDTDHRTLVFSQSIPVICMLGNVLQRAGERADVITGEMEQTERDARVARFMSAGNDEGPHVLLLSTQAMSTGVDLTRADTVVFMDHHDNPQNDSQAEARVYRLTQQRPVITVHLVTDDSAEADSAEGFMKHKQRAQDWLERTYVKLMEEEGVPAEQPPPASAAAPLTFQEFMRLAEARTGRDWARPADAPPDRVRPDENAVARHAERTPLDSFLRLQPSGADGGVDEAAQAAEAPTESDDDDADADADATDVDSDVDSDGAASSVT